MKKNSCSWFLSESTARINIQQSTHYDAGALLANTSSRTIRKAIWLYYLLSMLYNVGAFNLQETPALNINTLLFHWQLNVISLTNTIDINIPEFFLIEFEFPVAWSSLDTPFTLASSGKLVSVLCWYRSEPKKLQFGISHYVEPHPLQVWLLKSFDQWATSGMCRFDQHTHSLRHSVSM